MPRKKTEPLDWTSSHHKHLICDHCDRRFYKKNLLISHECMNKYKTDNNNTCKWCNVTFKSLACLSNHASLVHGDMSYSKLGKTPKSQIVKCNVCSKKFAELFQLRYHIRRTHFNLKAKIPYWTQKKVNQVWFEKVLNSNNVMEIRKAGPNVLVMRKLAENTAIKVADHDTEEIDVSHLYPTGRKYEAVECKLCFKKYGKRDLNKHMEEVHYKKIRHECNNCHLKFKRLYIFLKHVCNKPSARGLRRGERCVRISRVESLANQNL